jgi:hypothetical protein
MTGLCSWVEGDEEGMEEEISGNLPLNGEEIILAKVMSTGLKWVSKNCKILQKSSKKWAFFAKYFKIFQKNSIFFDPFQAILASVQPFGFRKKIIFQNLGGELRFQAG